MHNETVVEERAISVTEESKKEPEFFIVSTKKLSVLFVATLGFYLVYWYYMNWKMYKRHNNLNLWPVPRSIFTIFYTHSLFSNINEKINTKRLDRYYLSSSLATFYVVIALIVSIADKLSFNGIASPYSDLMSLATIPVLLTIFRKAQRAINNSEGDPLGSGNSTFTWANYIWITLGLLIWFFAIIGTLVILGVIPE